MDEVTSFIRLPTPLYLEEGGALWADVDWPWGVRSAAKFLFSLHGSLLQTFVLTRFSWWRSPEGGAALKAEPTFLFRLTKSQSFASHELHNRLGQNATTGRENPQKPL